LEDDELEDDVDAWAFGKLCEAKSRRYSTKRKYRKYTTNHFSEDLLVASTPPVQQEEGGGGQHQHQQEDEEVEEEKNDDEEENEGEKVPFLTDDEFLQKYRMGRAAFNGLVGLIKDHVVFKRGSRGRPQAAPEYQLMVFLKYIGTEGGGSSNPDLRNTFRMGRGTVDLYKKRVVKAIRSLRDRYYKWPNSDERAQIAERIRKEYGFPNCCGMADGTLNPLAFEPQTIDAPDYSGRKYGYSLSTLVVNDDRKRIIYYLAGWPGSAHDNRVFRNSKLCQKPSEFFSPTQYLLGDSAFACMPFMVSAYKKPQGAAIPREQEVFNGALSRPRVMSEHTIGIWKGRFPWLKSIRMPITDDKRTLRNILQFMDATVILHNYLIECADSIPNSWMDDDDASAVGDAITETDELNRSLAVGAPDDTRRRQLTNYFNEWYIL
jgi:hypothetical protein